MANLLPVAESLLATVKELQLELDTEKIFSSQLESELAQTKDILNHAQENMRKLAQDAFTERSARESFEKSLVSAVEQVRLKDDEITRYKQMLDDWHKSQEMHNRVIGTMNQERAKREVQFDAVMTELNSAIDRCKVCSGRKSGNFCTDCIDAVAAHQERMEDWSARKARKLARRSHAKKGE